MRRGNQFMKYSLFNVGAYAFGPDCLALRIIQTLRPSAALAPADDKIFEAVMRHGLLGAHVSELPAFNVNNA